MPVHPIFDRDTKLFYGFWAKGWRDVVGFEGMYEINHMCQVRNKKTKRILKTCRDRVPLYNKQKKKFIKVVYHLALEAFFPHIARNGRGVDHIDEDHSNNALNNLQWMIGTLNSTKSNKLRPRMTGVSRSKPVEQWSKDGNEKLREFTSTHEAARETGISQGHISKCARNQNQFSGKYLWRFKNLESQEDYHGEIWKTNDTLQNMLLSSKVCVSNMGRILTSNGLKTKGTKRPGSSGHRRYQNYSVHQLVWVVWGDGRPLPSNGSNLVVCHNDSIPRDEDNCVSNAIEHLRLDTRSANAKEYNHAKKIARMQESNQCVSKS